MGTRLGIYRYAQRKGEQLSVFAASLLPLAEIGCPTVDKSERVLSSLRQALHCHTNPDTLRVFEERPPTGLNEALHNLAAKNSFSSSCAVFHNTPSKTVANRCSRLSNDDTLGQ
ncbi:unnamed protein product [Dicrocoelium dendriticum]|nr:unnamed protein product [Dicrocoelium dendriticum]